MGTVLKEFRDESHSAINGEARTVEKGEVIEKVEDIAREFTRYSSGIHPANDHSDRTRES